MPKLSWVHLAVIVFVLIFLWSRKKGFQSMDLVDSKTIELKFRKPHQIVKFGPNINLATPQDNDPGVWKVVSGVGCKSDEGVSWDSIGQDREWGLIFVDHSPGERRTADIIKLLPSTKLMVVHDTEQPTYRWPENWVGRRNFQVKVSGVGTTLLQGDLDKDGKLFDQVVAAITEENKIKADKEALIKDLNPDGAPFHLYGTHLKLLLVTASLLVEKGEKGDILEMGAGLFSTSELHNVLVKDTDKTRMLVSVETDFNWIKELARNFTSEFHQFILVPVYSDLATCKLGSKELKISVDDARLLGLLLD